MENIPKKYRVFEEYESPYPDPIIFQQGDLVEVDRKFTEDPDWLNWVWCIAADNSEAWVPEQYLEISQNKGVFKRDYNAMELSVSVGETLFVYEIVNGFCMAEKSSGEIGWVPMNCLEMDKK